MFKVIEIERYGGPEGLRVGRREGPDLPPGHVLVRVAASGVNRADLLQRRGLYPPPAGFPEDIPGLEFSGEVEAVGEGCRLRKVGDGVMGILGGGGYGELVAVPERETVRAPDNLSLMEAGAIPEVFFTAWDALFGQARLQAGETVLIHAVGSGVGTAAMQLAHAAGAWTVGTSRTPEKVQRALGMGLDEGVVAGADGDWVREIEGRLERGGVDVLLDLVGASYLEGNQEVLGEGGRWIVVGVPGGTEARIDLRRLMAKRACLRGTMLRGRPPEEKALLAREFERTVVPLFESGRLEPILDRIFPAERAGDAHRYVEANRSFGKVLLDWRGDGTEGGGE